MMNKPDIRLLLTDLDGTLLHKDHTTVSQRTREALQALKERGVKLCACTGRPLCVLPPAIEEIGFDYIITCNGASCIDRITGEQIFHAWLTEEQARTGWEYVRQVDALIGWFTREGIVMDARNFAMWPERLRPHWHRSYFAAGKVRVVDDIAEFFDEGAPRLEKLNMYTVTPDTDERVVKPMRALGGYALASSLGRNMEITSAQADKGQALQTLCDHLGITMAQTIAFGDGGNDVNMLQMAGVGVAMGNASDAVKAFAGHATLSNEEDGVADFLEKHIL